MKSFRKFFSDLRLHCHQWWQVLKDVATSDDVWWRRALYTTGIVLLFILFMVLLVAVIVATVAVSLAFVLAINTGIVWCVVEGVRYLNIVDGVPEFTFKQYLVMGALLTLVWNILKSFRSMTTKTPTTSGTGKD